MPPGALDAYAPPVPRELSDEARALIDEVISWTEVMRAAELQRREAQDERAAAIKRAQTAGASLTVIAEALGGLSVERVRQMLAAGKAPKYSGVHVHAPSVQDQLQEADELEARTGKPPR